MANQSSHKKQGNRKHGMFGSRVYQVWADMKRRCLQSSHSAYKDYGQRGITVCERWLKFEHFYADMGNPPVGFTLDRINNDGNYEPSNCRWATWKEQGTNRRTNKSITFNGKTQCLSAWAVELGIERTALDYRLKHYSLRDAFTRPLRPYRTRR